jgi:hypothetical protein
MEPAEKKVRYKLLLTKAQVTSLHRGELGCKFKAITPNGMTVEADLSFVPDVRVGDILSIYTELYAHDQPGTASIQ